MERRLAAILAADVVGYSRLMGADEAGTLQRLKALRSELVQPRITGHGGRIVKVMGDGLLAEFPSVVEAVQCAVEIQSSLVGREGDLPEERRIALRIGVNLGDVIHEGADIYGEGVNVAARLEALAEPGGVCISRAVRDQVRDKLDIQLKDKGEVTVRNIERPVRIFFVEIHDQAVEEPCMLRADVRSFALLMGDHPAQENNDLRKARGLFLRAIERSKGVPLALVGDAIGATFDSAADAVAGAREALEAVAAWNSGVDAERRIQFRVGIDLADTTAAGGTGGNDALSAEIAAGPGEVCVCRGVYERLRDDVAFDFEPLGSPSDPATKFRLASASSAQMPTGPGVPLQCQGLDFPLPAKPSIILLPIEDLSANGELGHLAEGIRIDMQCALVKISGLFVIAAGTAGIYAKRRVTPGEVAEEMGVRYVFEGSVQGGGDRVRVNAQLHDAKTGGLVWSERYDRRLDDNFLVQDEIVEKIVASLDVKLVGGEQAKIWRKTLRSAKALELYYKGLELLMTFDKETVAAARQVFEAVSKIEPNVTLGPTSVAFCHYWDATLGWGDDPQESLAQTATWAARAAAMDDADGQAHIMLAHAKLLYGEYDEALRIAEEAVAIRPLCANTNALSGNILLYCGQPEAAIRRVKNAIRAAPVYASWWIEILAAAYRDSGQTGLAISASKEASRLTPEGTSGLTILTSVLSATGNSDLAQQCAEKILLLNPGFSLAAYARQQPYRDRSTLDAILASLRNAGLPE